MDHEGSNRVGRAAIGSEQSQRASRAWWDAEAEPYLAEHGSFPGRLGWLAEVRLGPEGLTEQDAGLLGPLAGRRVLEVGAGAAQASRWLLAAGAYPVALDLSAGMLAQAARLGAATGLSVPLVQGDAAALPFRSASFDLACSAYGAVPFVADVAAVFAEVARVLRPGARWVFAATHPVRWAFPDDPGPGGLTAERSYFDRRAYVERDEAGVPSYVEHHRTLGDTVRALTAAGFRILDLVEPEWPADNEQVWGAWSPLRGRILPGTAIWVCTLA